MEIIRLKDLTMIRPRLIFFLPLAELPVLLAVPAGLLPEPAVFPAEPGDLLTEPVLVLSVALAGVLFLAAAPGPAFALPALSLIAIWKASLIIDPKT
jgi:hypothetical protein